MHDTFSKAIAFAEIAENPCSCLRRSSQIALSSRERVLFPLHPEVISDHAKIGQTAVLRRNFPLPQQNNVPPAHLVYLRRFAKLIEVLPARNSATCAKVVAFCSATCYNMPCPWGYSSVGRALEWHSRGQGFDSPYLHHARPSRTYLFRTKSFGWVFCCLINLIFYIVLLRSHLNNLSSFTIGSSCL